MATAMVVEVERDKKTFSGSVCQRMPEASNEQKTQSI